MRAFVLTRKYFSDYKQLKEQISILEKTMDKKFKDVYEALNFLLNQKKHDNRKRIGFNSE
jgi:hypothetical protein